MVITSFVGRLQPPPFLAATFSTVDTMLISWHPPYTLLGISISQYTINITVSFLINDSNYLVVKEQTTIFTNDTFSSIAVNSENGALYEICVQGETEAGLGKEKCIKKSRSLGNVKRFVYFLYYRHKTNPSIHAYSYKPIYTH